MLGGKLVFSTNDIHEQLQQLPKLERKQLQSLWQDLFGNAPNPKLRRELLVPVLAYRMQEKAFGGLTPSVQRKLRAMAEEFNKTGKIGSKPTNVTRPGTRIIREWQGKIHEVCALESGFEYCNQQYRSLSEIARQITGTRWSGPSFFGLKKKANGGKNDRDS
jgi:hypothetical protein